MKHTSDHSLEVDTLLREHGLKRTEARVRVLTELMRAHEPLTVEMLAERLKDIHFVTLYRMLERFVEEGMVYQADFRNGKASFEYQPHHHHHITCTNCGRTEAVDVCVEPQEKKVLASAHHFESIASHVLEFFGRCKKCKI